MDKAKAAVSDFMHKSGHHDTTVHEKVAPAIVNENVTKHRHEEATTAVDREVHQDHYHTSVQPVKDREVLPEQHSHTMAPVEHRHQQHGDDAAIKARLEQERLQFQNTRSQGSTQESHSAAPTIAGEHVHHHVHETIQPVVQKETIQPSVVHTTIPIHEVHQNEAQHHSSSALPAVSMADFKKQGGSLTGREERYDGFEGEPRGVGSSLGGSHGHGSTNAGPHSSSAMNKADPRVDSDMDGSRNMGASGNTSTGYGETGTGTTGTHSSNAMNKADPRIDSDMDGSRNMGASGNSSTGYGGTGTGHTGTHGTSGTTGSKPSLMDKLNPMKDTDRDGKKGVME